MQRARPIWALLAVLGPMPNQGCDEGAPAPAAPLFEAGAGGAITPGPASDAAVVATFDASASTDAGGVDTGAPVPQVDASVAAPDAASILDAGGTGSAGNGPREVLLVGNSVSGSVSFLDARSFENLGSVNVIPDLNEVLALI